MPRPAVPRANAAEERARRIATGPLAPAEETDDLLRTRTRRRARGHDGPPATHIPRIRGPVAGQQRRTLRSAAVSAVTRVKPAMNGNRLRCGIIYIA